MLFLLGVGGGAQAPPYIIRNYPELLRGGGARARNAGSQAVGIQAVGKDND